MDRLREGLIDFQRLTENLINSLRAEDYDALEDIFNKREKIIKTINSLNYNNEDFKTIASELRLLELDNELNKLLSEKRQSVREQIDKLKTVKKANSNYQRNFQLDSIFLSKKI